MTVRYDPRDAAELRVYHGDEFLCRAIAPELAADSISLDELKTARNARRRALKQQLRNRRSLADALPDDTLYLSACEIPPPAPDPQHPMPPRSRLRTYATD